MIQCDGCEKGACYTLPLGCDCDCHKEYPNDKETQEWMNAPLGEPIDHEKTIRFWADKYEKRSDEFYDLHNRCVKAECDFAAANKKIKEMEAVIYAVGDYVSNHKDDRFGSRRRLLDAYNNYENLKEGL